MKVAYTLILCAVFLASCSVDTVNVYTTESFKILSPNTTLDVESEVESKETTHAPAEKSD